MVIVVCLGETVLGDIRLFAWPPPIRSRPVKYGASQTAVTAYLKSKQLLLFVFAWR